MNTKEDLPFLEELKASSQADEMAQLANMYFILQLDVVAWEKHLTE